MAAEPVFMLGMSQRTALAVSAMLASAGWASHYFPIFHEGIGTLESSPPRAVLVEIADPAYADRQAAMAIRSLDQHVLLFALELKDADCMFAARAARRAGARHLTASPYDPATLLRHVRNASDEAATGKRKPLVLIVDDSRTVAATARMALLEAGFRCEVAPSIEAAEQMPVLAICDAVLLDVFMPGVGGIAGLPVLRAHAPNARFCIMSGGLEAKMGADDVLRAAQAVGADATIAKPFTSGGLAMTVRRMLAQETPEPRVLSA